MHEVQTRLQRSRIIRERYLIEELLGEGGAGAVYRVRDRRVRGNVFALKEVVDPNRHQRAGFLFEGDVLQRLDHHALPRVYHVFEDEKYRRLYMLMDYIDGPNLERLRHLQPGHRFQVSQALRIMRPIIEAVSYLHAQQPPIIHRDIKPGNIIVPTSDAGAILVDFGTSKEYDLDSTTTAVRYCSPGYGAPEQYVYGTSTQTDVYGLGATFYTLLTGTTPIDALYRITQLTNKGTDPLKAANELEPSLPQPLVDVLQRALALNSEKRFETVEEFWKALHAAAPVEESAMQGLFAQKEQIAMTVEQDETVRFVCTTPTPIVPETPAISISLEHVVQNSRVQFRLRRRVQHLMKALLALALIAFVSGVTFGATHWVTGKQTEIAGKDKSSSKMTLLHDGVPTVPVPTLPPTIVPKNTPPATVTVAGYPLLLTEYSGEIHNSPASVNSTMALSQVHQNGLNISGDFLVGPGLLGSGSFTGQVTNRDSIHFLVPSRGDILPLYFEGQFQSDNSISGTYCSYQQGRCDYAAGGYGNWTVAPPLSPGLAAETHVFFRPYTHPPILPADEPIHVSPLPRQHLHKE